MKCGIDPMWPAFAGAYHCSACAESGDTGVGFNADERWVAIYAAVPKGFRLTRRVM